MLQQKCIKLLPLMHHERLELLGGMVQASGQKQRKRKHFTNEETHFPFSVNI